jgi:hypothetical protein
MARKPIGARPMTPAERQQRRRERVRAAYPPPTVGDPAWLRDRLIAQIEFWRLMRPDVSTAEIADFLQQWITDRYRMAAFWEAARKSQQDEDDLAGSNVQNAN